MQRLACQDRRQSFLHATITYRTMLYMLAGYSWLGLLVQIEGADGGDQHPLGSEYYTTLRSEADNDVNAATIASEEAEAEINR